MKAPQNNACRSAILQQRGNERKKAGDTHAAVMISCQHNPTA